MADTIADQIEAGKDVYVDEAWDRLSVEFFRPTLSPDSQGGSTVTVPVTATGTVAADPVMNVSGQTMLVDKDEDIRVGDIVKLSLSQFRA